MLENIVNQLLQVEKTLYEVGYGHHMFRFWAESFWFMVSDSPPDALRVTFERFATDIDRLLAKSQFCDGAIDCLRQVHNAAKDCWKDLNENWNRPERSQIASMIENLEREFLTDDLWKNHTNLNRPAWKEFASTLEPLQMALGQPFLVLVETGSLVAQVQTMGFGSFAVWDREQRPVPELEYALTKLREYYPQLNSLDFDLSESRLREEQFRRRLTFNQVALARAESIHAALFERLSDVVAHQPDESDGRNSDSDVVARGRYVLEKKTDKIIQVEFDGESGVMTGNGAFRIHLLISWERIHLLQISGDLELGEKMPSIKAGEAVIERSKDAEIGIPSGDKKFQKLCELRTIHKKVRVLNAEIEDTKNVAERQELEQERDSYLEYVKKFLRSDPSQYTKARDRVDKGFRTKIKELTETMPRFAQHLRAAKSYDERTDEYTYLPSERISWKFKNFG